MTKIAVCLSGQLRTCDVAAPSILSFFSNYDVDYFIHTWDSNTWFKQDSDKKAETFEIEHLDRNSIIRQISKFNPKSFYIDKYKSFIFPVAQSQQYSMLKANALKISHEINTDTEYDVVVKCRFDMIWHPNEKLILPRNIDRKTAYFSYIDYDQHADSPMALDRWFFGSSQVMNNISNIYWETTHRLNKPNANFDPLVPERFLYEYCRGLNIQMNQVGHIGSLVRQSAFGLDCVKDYQKIIQLDKDFYKSHQI